MNKTELIIFHRPNSGGLVTINDSSPTSSNYFYAQRANPNQPIEPVVIGPVRDRGKSGQGLRVDLYDNISIPLTYTILDIREPDKRKTSWSKSIKIPGTKNNNSIFGHIYQLGKDGWITIGNTSVYQGFNPNIRKEVIILNDGIQVFKGNMQLKSLTKDKDGNIEYEIALSGDLTSLFYDVGNAKLSDLDFSEWDHEWSRLNIMNSWSGTLLRNGTGYQGKTFTTVGTKITRLSRQSSTGRLQITMQTNHGLAEEDWVRVQVYGSGSSQFFSTANGEWCVAEIVDTKTFTINYKYPPALTNWSEDVSGWNFLVSKVTYTGKGYVYPMISWGDEYDANSFPVTSFVPAFFVKEIWDKIMAETNSSYESDFLDSQFFKRLIMIQRKSEYKVSSDDAKARTFRVGTNKPYISTITQGPVCTNNPRWSLSMPWWINGLASLSATSSQSASASFAYTQVTNDPNTKVPFSVESGGVGTGSYCDGDCDGYDPNTGQFSYNNWDNSTFKWKVPRSGEYQISAQFKLSAWMDMNGFSGTPSDGTASFRPNGQAGTSSVWRYYPYDLSRGIPHGELGYYKVGAKITATMYMKRNGVTTKIAEGYLPFEVDRAQWWNENYTNSNPAPGWKYFGRYQPSSWENRDLLVNASNRYFQAGDEVWVRLEYFLQSTSNTIGGYGEYDATVGRYMGYLFTEVKYLNSFGSYGSGTQFKPIKGDFFVKVEQPAFMWNVPSSKSTENSIIEASQFLPSEMSCKDFLLSIIKMFNLHIEADRTVERKYYIEPRDDYYYDGSGGTSDYVDWSNKIDEDSVEIVPMGALISKYYTFENKEESDYWNKKFKEERGRPYMKYTKEVENDFLKNETKITVPLGSTVMINNPEDSDVVMPSIVQREANGSQKPVTNSAPRILIWGGIRPYTKLGSFIPDLGSFGDPNDPQTATGQQGWEMVSSTTVAPLAATSSGGLAIYPYAGTVDSPNDPMYDINWFNMEEGDFVYWDNARWSSHNLFNAYWKNFITEISDPSSSLIKCDVRLTPTDIFNLDFRKIYLIDRTYCRLQKVIDYDPNSDGLTKVELLKLKLPTRFKRRSIWNGEILETVLIDKGTIPVTVKYQPPQKIKPSFGYTNANPNSNLSNNPSIGIKGKGNWIGSSKNIDIVGDENAIGDQTSNVNIKGGSGNFVGGGLNNVTIIGTSKKVINESDVTYINGIRYKNGVPISRSNVINGGSDKVFERNMSMNTTVNVVSGGEDSVQSQGSTTYENVVISGQNCIAPDIAELGISTNTTPNPRTNLSGGFAYQSATSSLIDVIRRSSARSNDQPTQFNL